ncbi:hypothetical protein [Chelatococcus reniformis]|nr:hypothetical protein [Chelatococcus reniformis]
MSAGDLGPVAGLLMGLASSLHCAGLWRGAAFMVASASAPSRRSP